MVAMALKAMLEDLGCVVVGTVGRLREAEQIVGKESLDGVLLDLNLGGQYSYPVIDVLHAREIPFIIMSGYDVAQLRPALAKEASMQKPFEREALAVMMLKVFTKRRRRGPEQRRDGAPRSPSDVPEGGDPEAPTESGSASKRFSKAESGSGSKSPPTGVPTPSLKTRGEIESAVCHGMCAFEQEYLGRGPKDVDAHLMGELLVVRLHGVLTAAEQHLVRTCPADQGRDLLKRMRSLLIEGARPQIESMIQLITGVTVGSLHHDISTTTGEELVVFTLNAPPAFRPSKSRS